MNFLFVFIGGGVGSVFRYGVGQVFTKFYNGNLPLSTLTSNVLSCIILALVMSNSAQLSGNSKWINLALVVGFCGGFSTFSTFSFETVQLIKNGNHLVAVGNIMLSVFVCLILLFKLTK